MLKDYITNHTYTRKLDSIYNKKQPFRKTFLKNTIRNQMPN